MRIGKYELGFNERRIWANVHKNVSKDDGVVYEPNVCIPIKDLYIRPIDTISCIIRVFCGKYPFKIL